MKRITKEMYDMYDMKNLGYDFMGYIFDNKEQLSFHHLIIPKRHHGPEIISNGAILTQCQEVSSHDYLHIIEHRDYDLFLAITSEMIDENIKGKIDVYNLKRIRDMLIYFEKEHCSDRTRKGKLLIKEHFISKRAKF